MENWEDEELYERNNFFQKEDEDFDEEELQEERFNKKYGDK